MPLSSRRAHSTLGAAWIAQLLVLTLLGGAAPQLHAEVTTVSVESPNKVLQVSLEVDGGTPYYRVQRLGEAVVQRSRLGFELRDGRLDRGMAVLAQARQSHDDTWEQPWGETRLVRNHYNELRVSLGERDGAQRTFDVIFRVYDDGLGLRYHFPKQAGMREAFIDEEVTEFAIAQPADAWWIPAGEPIHYEYLYRHTPLNQVALAHTPLTLRTDSGLHIALHEAALVDYAGMWLRRTDNQRLRAQLSPAAEGWKVRRSLPFDTPWRTLQIADQATGLVESNLILNLNEPNILGDVSWIKPSKYVGVWWSMHLNQQTWARWRGSWRCM